MGEWEMQSIAYGTLEGSNKMATDKVEEEMIERVIQRFQVVFGDISFQRSSPMSNSFVEHPTRRLKVNHKIRPYQFCLEFRRNSIVQTQFVVA